MKIRIYYKNDENYVYDRITKTERDGYILICYRDKENYIIINLAEVYEVRCENS